MVTDAKSDRGSCNCHAPGQDLVVQELLISYYMILNYHHSYILYILLTTVLLH